MPRCNAGGNAHGELPILLHAARTFAGQARLGDDRPGAAALSAGARDGEEPLLIPQLTAALALRAGGRLRPFGRARAVARLTLLLPGDLQRHLGALGRFLERDLQVVAQIGTALRAAAAAALPEDVAQPEDVAEAAEDVFESGEDVGVEAAGGGTAQARVAEAVVHVALVGIGQHRVGLGRFLEGILGLLVAGIAVGVVLEGELAVRALDFLIRRGLGDAKHFVVIALAHDRATFTIAARSRRSPSM